MKLYLSECQYDEGNTILYLVKATNKKEALNKIYQDCECEVAKKNIKIFDIEKDMKNTDIYFIGTLLED